MISSPTIEIVGGGLAGLSLGRALRQAGVAVTIFEAAGYPRHRVCGEFIAGLSPETAARLKLAPMLDDSLLHRGVAWFVRDQHPRVQRLQAPALGLSRHRLDARLATAFVAAGGDLRTQCRMVDLAPRPGRILATGRRPGRSPWIGLKVHLEGLPLERDLEVHLGDNAYVGLSGVENGRVNLCGLFRRRKLSAPGFSLIQAYLKAAGLDSLGARIGTARADEESFCAVAAVSFDPGVPRSEGLCLGDACAVTPPFTGNGMAMAFQSAETALDPILDYVGGKTSWEETCRTIHAALRRRFRVRLASAHVLHPYLLAPGRQRWLAVLNRARLLPFRPLYAALH